MNNKLKGFGTLNNLYRQLLKLNLNFYKNIFNYTARLKGIYINITNISSYLKLKTNFLTFLFHTSLSKAYDIYFIYYIQNYKPINDINIEVVFFLKYVISRFIQIVINLFSKRTEFNYTFTAYR